MDKTAIGYKDIIKQKEYMKTVYASIINRLGDSIDSIAFVWLTYQITQSAAWSAIIFGVNRVPTIFVQPLAGAAIEGKNKKNIMVSTDVIRGICVGFVATALLMGFLNRWILLLATIIISTAEAFRGPASTALIPKLLDKKYYEFGLSLNTSASSIMELIGVGIGGIIISTFSLSTAIYIDMVTFLVSAIIILTLKVKEDKVAKSKTEIKKYTNDLLEGFAYLNKKKLLKNFAILAVFLNAVLVPLNSLQAPLVSEVLRSNEIMLSVFSVSITLGMIIGATVYPYASRKLKAHVIAGIGCYSIGIYYIVLVLLGNYINSNVLMYIMVSVASVVSGAAIALTSSLCNVEVIKNVEEKYLARVTSILGASCMAAIPITSFIISAFVDTVSTATLFIIASVVGFIVCICLCTKKRITVAMEEDAKTNEIKKNVETTEILGNIEEAEITVNGENIENIENTERELI